MHKSCHREHSIWEIRVHGRITKAGNKYLRWAMVEAVWPAIQRDVELNQYYHRLAQRKGPQPS